ncbi:hypothetical protein CU254_21730 [Amycolatopsis sp. AA4]|uniref:MaoC/PaaZ C-terminal domain-containing protein n=1 Tax=Actinomycetes TaxID=1760 RepID=UPI0001B57076|nr:MULTISPECIES: MaoC/PaaZ C-terminal domain-containing protein [Actinomycetes]ATY12786.1 hypothetical protein CU254_21730 [Amycolatopsis sp. AA4]EFL08606.1 predicted protein [Streptomyces sp. AA4]
MRGLPELLTPFEWRFARVGPDTVRTSVDSNSAVFAGHFPERPVVPGVCLIDLVRQAAAELGFPVPPGLDVARARFVDAVRPGDELETTVSAGPDGQLTGAVRRRGEPVCQIRFAAP